MNSSRPSAAYFAAGIAALLGVALWAFLSRAPHREPSPAIHSLAISLSGEWFARGTALGQVRVWRFGHPEVSRTIEVSNGALNDLQFSNNSDSLAIANKNIVILNLKDGSTTNQIEKDEANYGTVRFSPDDKTLLTVNGKSEILAIDLQTNVSRRIYCCTSIYGEVAFTPDGAQVAWAGHWPGLLDVQTNAVIGRLSKDRELMTLGPIAADQPGEIYMGSQDGRVYQWDLKTKARIAQSPAQTGYVRSITVIGETGWIAYAPEDGPVTIWNPATGLSRPVQGTHTTSNLVFDKTRNQTAFGTATGDIQFWDLVEGRLLRTVPRNSE